MSTGSEQQVPAVMAAEPRYADRVFGVLTLAFADDPPNRWMYPELGQYLAHFPGFRSSAGRRCVAFANRFREPGLFRRRSVAGPRCRPR